VAISDYRSLSPYDILEGTNNKSPASSHASGSVAWTLSIQPNAMRESGVVPWVLGVAFGASKEVVKCNS
jgi:hypothetical protein